MDLRLTQNVLARSLIAANIAFVATLAQAEADALPVVEELIVSAQQQNDNSADLPLAIDLYSGADLRLSGLIDMQALAERAPNLSYSQSTGASDNIVMRGLGSVGSGPHLEQGVALIYDGVFSRRSRIGRRSFFDVQQVEILRGPQGALVSQNTSLGAINVVSKRPSNTREAQVYMRHEFEASEGQQVGGVVSGPIADQWLGRLALEYQDQDGWVENRPTGEAHQSREDWSGRGILQWQPSENFNGELLVEQRDFDRLGKPREVEGCVDPQAVAELSPGEDCSVNGRNNSVAIIGASNGGEFFNFDAHSSLLTLNWQFGQFKLKSLTSYLNYDIEDQFDADLTPEQSRWAFNREQYAQQGQEIRLLWSEGWLSWQVGFVYQMSDMDFEQLFDNQTARRRVEEAEIETDTQSLFAQVDRQLNEHFSVVAGLRWTRETREGWKDQWQNQLDSDIRDDSLCGPNASGLTSCFAEPLTGEFTDDLGAGNIAGRWHLSEQSMLYASLVSSAKAGGFNIRQNVASEATQSAFEFEPERATSLELGGKHRGEKKLIEANWALFYTRVNDLQLSSHDADTLTQSVVNGDAISYGIEYQLKWQLPKGWQAGINGTLTHAHYDDYLVPCYDGQSESDGCSVDANEDGNFDSQSVDDKPLPYAPRYSATITLSREITAFDDYSLRWQADVIRVGGQQLGIINDPQAREPGFTKIDANLQLLPSHQRWQLALLVRNLTDTKVRTGSEATTALNAAGGARFAYLAETRAVSLSARYNF